MTLTDLVSRMATNRRARRVISRATSAKVDDEYEAKIQSLEVRLQVLNDELDLQAIRHASTDDHDHRDSSTAD